jgi:hypothetical protein
VARDDDRHGRRAVRPRRRPDDEGQPHPEVYADAAYEVLTRPAREYTGQTLIVEQVLRDAGVTDFSRYAATPGTPDHELFPDIFL